MLTNFYYGNKKYQIKVERNKAKVYKDNNKVANRKAHEIIRTYFQCKDYETIHER